MDKKTIAIGTVAVIAAAGIIYAVTQKDNKNADENKNLVPISTDTNSGNASGTPETASSTKPTTTKPKTLSYGDAIKAYPYRFQFIDCHGTPGTISMKKGGKLMLDNRDKKSHKIAFSGQTYTIQALGFMIVTPTKVGTHIVTCDGGGAAELNIEN